MTRTPFISVFINGAALSGLYLLRTAGTHRYSQPSELFTSHDSWSVFFKYTRKSQEEDDGRRTSSRVCSKVRSPGLATYEMWMLYHSF